MLIRSTEDIKKFFPVTEGFDFEDFLPHLNSALEKYIYPFLSQAQYDDLDAAFKSDPQILNPRQEALLPYVQRMLVNAGMFKYAFLGDKIIGKNGISVNETESVKMAAQWRIEDLKEYALNEYDDATESLLEYLEKNKTYYELWTSSQAYTLFRECFINSSEEFSDLFRLGNKRRTFLALKGLMKQVEIDSIMSVTGKDLFDEIKSQIYSNTVSANNSALLLMIMPCVASLTGARACGELAFAIEDGGLTVMSTSSSLTQKVKSAPTENVLSFKMKSAMEYGERYQEKLRKYLFANHGTYPLYEADTSVYIVSPTTDINTAGSGVYGMM
jgi:hypothetical protein